MGFSKNVLMAETSYQMLEDLSFCEVDSLARLIKITALTFE